jgi:DNA polymerase
MASDIYKFKVIKDVHDHERFVGKQAILGLGYQMAHIKFRNRNLDFDVELSIPFCKAVVKLYRKKYKKVESLWYETNDAAIAAVRHPGRKFYTAGKKVYYQMYKRWLYCYLPSGRRMAYVEPKVVDVWKWGKDIPTLTYAGYDSFKRKWVRLETFGGKLVENIAQGITADICDGGMQRAEERGYHVVFPVHDEVIAEVDEDFGSVKEFEDILCETPSWGKGLPVAAEGWEGMRYKK